MRGLHIIERDDYHVYWRYNNEDGESYIEDGKAVDAFLSEDTFMLMPDATTRIIKAANHWLQGQTP